MTDTSVNLTDTWNKVLDVISRELAPTNFENYLKKTTAVYVEDNTLYVQVQNQFTKDWVEARYASALRKTLRRIVADDLELRFLIPNQTHLQSMLQRNTEPQLNQGLREKQDISADEEESARLYNLLDKRYRFDSFVVGDSNRFAHAASLAVAESPAKAYNPLFLYGGVGLGKTHLMYAIGHHAYEQNHRLRIVYVSSETFTNELITAIGKKSMMEFRNKYRTVDVLLIDDVQSVAGRESTQEELYNTFNALYQANKQIIISSDRPPKEIPTLEERLRSRFEWGLITDVQAPDLETRVAILQKKATSMNLDLEMDSQVLPYIAKHVHSNIRELEGAFNRVVAEAKFSGNRITLESAVNGLKDIVSALQPKPVSIEKIQAVTANHYALKPSDMKSKKRTRTIAYPRQIAMFLARELTDCSLPKIGAEFGGRDHSTVIHACDRIVKDLDTNPSLQMVIKELTDMILKS